MNQKDFLGSGITWFHSDFSCWRIAAKNVPFAAEVPEVDCRQDLHSVAVELERVQRQALAVRRLLKPIGFLGEDGAQHRAFGAGEILAQVSFFGGYPWPFAVVTTTEHGRAQSHVSVAILPLRPTGPQPEPKIPKGAACFLTNSRMIAIAGRAEDFSDYRLRGHSLGFTLALESGRTKSACPLLTTCTVFLSAKCWAGLIAASSICRRAL